MYDPIKPAATPLDHLPVPLTLSVAQINYLLTVLGKRPLEECLGTFTTIRQQADAVVAQATAPPPVERAPAAPITDDVSG